MLFILSLFLAAIFLEAIGTYVSVIGLSQSFAGDPVILTLAITFDVIKLLVVSLVYNHWKILPALLKLFMPVVLVVTMAITSYGTAGYLQQSFSSALLPAQEKQIVLDGYLEEREKYEKRLSQINDQLAGINADYVSKRLKERRALEPELHRLQQRTLFLDSEIPKLKMEIQQIEVHAGPISAISKSTGLSPGQAANVIIYMIILIFDPLAVLLIVSANVLLFNRRKETEVDDATLDAGHTAVLTWSDDEVRKHVSKEKFKEKLVAKIVTELDTKIGMDEVSKEPIKPKVHTPSSEKYNVIPPTNFKSLLDDVDATSDVKQTTVKSSLLNTYRE